MSYTITQGPGASHIKINKNTARDVSHANCYLTFRGDGRKLSPKAVPKYLTLLGMLYAPFLRQ